MSSKPQATVVFDVGKTNVKLCALGAAGETLTARSRPNAVLGGPPYPHHDASALFDWALDGLAAFARELSVDAIVTTTHGATAALMAGDELVLPVLDYEHDVSAFDDEYEKLARAFELTGSPRLAVGLNLGRQLFWQARSFPEAFARTSEILLYPQYFAFRFSGQKVSEVTSLGCHTDLWWARSSEYSRLVSELGWSALFPPRAEAWSKVGSLRPELARRTGLAAETPVLAGIHDSNASFFPYRAGRKPPFTVVSSGTWVIAMAAGSNAELDPERDLLLNVDAFGSAVASSRFMGGREYAAIAGERGLSLAVAPAAVAALIRRSTVALPCFAKEGGPFRTRAGEVRGKTPQNDDERAALATLYVALMTDYCLDLLGASGELLIEGSFSKNPTLLGLLAALRPAQPTFVSADATGTTLGAASLARFADGKVQKPALSACPPLMLPGLADYRDMFRELAEK